MKTLEEKTLENFPYETMLRKNMDGTEYIHYTIDLGDVVIYLFTGEGKPIQFWGEKDREIAREELT